MDAVILRFEFLILRIKTSDVCISPWRNGSVNCSAYIWVFLLLLLMLFTYFCFHFTVVTSDTKHLLFLTKLALESVHLLVRPLYYCPRTPYCFRNAFHRRIQSMEINLKRVMFFVWSALSIIIPVTLRLPHEWGYVISSVANFMQQIYRLSIYLNFPTEYEYRKYDQGRSQVKVKLSLCLIN
jgi:hypothetical protein